MGWHGITWIDTRKVSYKRMLLEGYAKSPSLLSPTLLAFQWHPGLKRLTKGDVSPLRPVAPGRYSHLVPFPAMERSRWLQQGVVRLPPGVRIAGSAPGSNVIQVAGSRSGV